MSPEAGKAALSIAMFIVVGSGGLLLIQPPGSAEFVVTVMSLVVGLIFAAVAALVIRRGLK